jgi:hypothetical protein
MKKNNKKMFVVRKYIMADNAKQAIRLDKTTPVDDVWIDTDFQKRQFEQLAGAIGFAHYPQDEE